MHMPNFAENLKSLAPITDIQRLELVDASGTCVAAIENKPGQQGSLAVYRHLHQHHGRIDAAAAREGLDLYAEHTADARTNPGKHPNIDRLIAIADGAAALIARIVPA